MMGHDDGRLGFNHSNTSITANSNIISITAIDIYDCTIEYVISIVSRNNDFTCGKMMTVQAVRQ